MDLQFGETLDVLIYSSPKNSTIFINPTRNWKEIMRVRGRCKKDWKPINIETFMMQSLGWENLLKTIHDLEGWVTSWSLDISCHDKEDFYDMFLDIHHE